MIYRARAPMAGTRKKPGSILFNIYRVIKMIYRDPFIIYRVIKMIYRDLFNVYRVIKMIYRDLFNVYRVIKMIYRVIKDQKTAASVRECY
jgi:hypothetical protein